MAKTPPYRKQEPKQPAQHQRRQALPKRLDLPRWLIITLCLFLTAGTTWAVFEFVVWNQLPPALVGKWVVADGDQEGATFDFYRGGTMLGRINVQGREGIIKARVKVEADTLFSTTRNPHTGQADTRTQKIKLLTATELVLEDDRGYVLRMARAD